MPEELPDPRRWWRRGDGLIFMVTDPDHIKRLLSEGWQEAAGPTGDVLPAAPASSADVAAEDELINPPELAGEVGAAKAKPIKKAVIPGEEA